MGKDIEFRWNVDEQTLIENRLGINDALQHFLAMTCYGHMTPFVPMDTGMLQGTVDISSDADHGEIHYLQPYAHYIYTDGNGKGLNFQLTHHPLATSYWDKAMWIMNKDQIVSEVDAYRKRISQ